MTAAAGFTCPRCGRTSRNPNDIHEGYCGACHDWTGGKTVVEELRAAMDALTARTERQGEPS